MINHASMVGVGYFVGRALISEGHLSRSTVGLAAITIANTVGRNLFSTPSLAYCLGAGVAVSAALPVASRVASVVSWLTTNTPEAPVEQEKVES